MEMVAKLRQEKDAVESRAADYLYGQARKQGQDALMYGATAVTRKTAEGAVLTVKKNNV